MQLQSLERRRYLTELSISGTSSADAIDLTVAGVTKAGLDVRIANHGTRSITVKVGANAVQLAAAATIRTEQITTGGVTLVRVVDLGAGDDRLTTDTAVNVRMYVSGGRGSDTITGGSSDDRIDGGDGDDSLSGGKGRDTLTGGDNFDVIDGGSGNDVLYADDAANSHTAAYAYQGIEFDGIGFLFLSDQLSGGVGDDRLEANGVADASTDGTGLFGDAGNDTLNGAAAGSSFFGGDGNDTLNGTAGNDRLLGDAGDDSVTAGAGNDTLAGGDGSDTLVGGLGDDTYDYHLRATAAETDRVVEYANGGRDRFEFDALLDRPENIFTGTDLSTADGALVDLANAKNLIRTGARRVVTDAGLQNNFEDVEGGPQQDTIYGNAADNLLSGVDSYFIADTAGDPRFFVIDGADLIDGRGGRDTLQGNGPDTVTGGVGDDHYVIDVMGNAQSKALTVSDTSGHDTETIEYAVNLIDDFSLGAIGVVDTLRMGDGIENLNLMYGAVGHVYGNDLANVIHVNDDQYYHSFPVAFGTVSGGRGNDTIIGNLRDADDQPQTLDSFTGAGATVLEGNDGDDLLIGETDPNDPDTRLFLRGGAGRDRLRSTGGPSYLDLSDSPRGVNADLRTGTVAGPDGKIDTFDKSVANVRGSAFNDTISGTDGPNVIYGMGGDDRISGFGDNDTIGGGLYHDRGDVPDDLKPLTTRDGNDTLSGGAGSDTVDYLARTNGLRLALDGKSGSGAKGEADYVGGDNEIVVTGSGNDSLAAGQAGTTFVGSLGADTFVGGAGQDVVRYDDEAHESKGGVTVTLDGKRDDGVAGENDFVTASIDAVVGTSDGDRLTAGVRPALLDGGTGGQDSLVGGPASDNLVLPGFGSGSVADGNGGDDVFVNQNGIPDTLDGGDGFDSVQDDDSDSNTPGLQNDTITNTEFVYDVLDPTATASATNVADAGPDAASGPAAVFVDATPSAVVSGVSVGLVGQKLQITGTASADLIQLTQVGRNVTVRVGSGLASAGVFAASSFTSIAISAGGGNDTVRLADAAGGSPLQAGARVSAGAGNDTLFGGDGNDQLAGEAGDDYVSGGLGNDIVSGDYVVLRGEDVPDAASAPDGNDTVIGGGGSVDIVTYTYRSAAVSLDLASGGASGARGEKDRISGVEYVIGGQNSDVIKGSTVKDTLFGGPGGDDLRGGAGADRVYAGIGADTVTPDGGSDFIDTGPDAVQDTVVASLDDTGYHPRSAAGVLLTGAFNSDDYFTLAGRHFGEGKT